ncbi:MAG: glycosyltransferase [Lachnospiraceae bacterium]|nr:glycosyltransferase [Lachnospiraceae bacterium]
MQAWKKIIRYIKEYGWGYTVRKIRNRFLIKYYLGKKYYPYSISVEDREKQQELCEQKNIPLVSIIVPVYNTPEKFFREMLDSVLDQTYSRWELCLADASDKDEAGEIIAEYSAKDSRIRYHRIKENRGISENSNMAWKMAHGKYIALLDHDDLLHPSALYYAVKEIMEKNVDFVYTDELSFIKKTSVVQSIHFKSDFHWESFRNTNYICHFSVFRRELMERVGGFRKEFDGAQDYDLFLRMAEITDKIAHIPKVLYYWRLHSGSSASGLQAKPYVTDAGRKALEQHMERMGIGGEVVARTELGPYYHIRYQVNTATRVLVFVEDAATESFISQTLKSCPYSVCIESGELMKKNQGIYDCIILVKRGYIPEKTGYEWLEEILQCLQTEENELVGVATYDAQGRYIQAGYCFDRKWDEKIRPLYQGVPIKDPAYMNRLLFRQTVDILDGAVLGMSRELFEVWRGEAGDSIFEQRQWFRLSMLAGERGKECVLSPCIRWKYVDKKSDAIECDWSGEVDIGEMERGSCCHPDMGIFGNMYFLWKN